MPPTGHPKDPAEHPSQHSGGTSKPKPKVDKMTTPFTTIINPLYQATGAGDPQLLTFWIDGGSDLVLQARTTYVTINEPTFTTNPSGDETGPLENPSCLTSFVYNSLLCVYGIAPSKNVVRISPTLQVVDSENANIEHNAPSLAGCSNGGNDAWLYFFQAGGGGRQKLKEYDLSSMQLGTTLGTIEVDEFSKLAAVWVDDNTRCVFYQITGDKDSNIGIADPLTGTGGPIPSATNVLDKSPIAACLVDGAIWVYYLDKSLDIKKLIVDVANVAQGSANLDSIPPPTTLNPDTPLRYSLLSASSSPSNRKTYVTYAVGSEENPLMRCYVDEWPAKTSTWGF